MSDNAKNRDQKDPKTSANQQEKGNYGSDNRSQQGSRSGAEDRSQKRTGTSDDR